MPTERCSAVLTDFWSCGLSKPKTRRIPLDRAIPESYPDSRRDWPSPQKEKRKNWRFSRRPSRTQEAPEDQPRLSRRAQPRSAASIPQGRNAGPGRQARPARCGYLARPAVLLSPQAH
ncbi:MAG: hypothetical protein HW397_613 [Dehalococcoidia bacterium]|nr:hypothetical protein [Dehalococcoidia bacterium]